MTQVADPFVTSDDAYWLMVAGAMNPAIHHPRWYLFIKALSEAEVVEAESRAASAGAALDASAQASNLVCNPQFSQFTSGALRMVCYQNQWWIGTTQAACLERLREIGDLVFKALPHTPVSAFTLSFLFHRVTKHDDVGTKLADLAQRLPFGFRSSGPSARVSAGFQYSTSVGERNLSVSVQPSLQGSKKVFLQFDVQHQIHATGQFDLGPMLHESFGQDPREVKEWMARILEGIDGL